MKHRVMLSYNEHETKLIDVEADDFNQAAELAINRIYDLHPNAFNVEIVEQFSVEA